MQSASNEKSERCDEVAARGWESSVDGWGNDVVKFTLRSPRKTRFRVKRVSAFESPHVHNDFHMFDRVLHHVSYIEHPRRVDGS